MSTKLKILHLEDLQFDIELVDRELKKGKIDFDKRVVSNRADYEKALKEFNPDIILSDHSLPSFNSVEALKLAREISYFDVPFILVTGTVSEDFAVEMMKKGIYDYILKDRIQRLPQAVQNAIEKKKVEIERQKFLERIVENESLMEEAERLAHFGSWQIDLVKNKMKWSNEVYRILGHGSRDTEPTLEKYLKYVHPEDIGFVQTSLFTNAPQAEHAIKINYRIQDNFNQIKFIRCEVFVERNNLHRPVRMIGFILDVTEVQRAEEEKRKAEQNLKTAYEMLMFHLENTPLGFIEWDSKLQIRSASKRAEEIFGWSMDDYIESKEPEFAKVFEADAPKASKLAENMLRGDILRSNFQVRNYRRDKKVIWCNWFNSVQRNKDGKVLSVMSLVQDITESKAAEELLRQSRSSLKAIIENTEATIYSIDKDFRYITFNQRLFQTIKDLFGVEIAPGDVVFDLNEKTDPVDTKFWNDVYTRAFTGEPVKFERKYVIHEVDAFVSFSIYPIWENHDIIGLSCYAVDITKQKLDELYKDRLSSDVMQRNKNLEQFSYIVSHNLRSPVANILGLTSVLQGKDLDEKLKNEMLSGLFSSVNKLDEVIKDLNQILQIKKDVAEKKENVSLSGLIEDIKTSLSKIIANENAKIICDFKDRDEIFTIKSYLHSIFYNLITNSLKYKRPNVPPVIEISSRLVKDKLVIKVKDNGLGIDMKKKGDQVFGLYKRFHSDSAEGKGMGLFMVKTQVETIGGKIGLTSEVNAGTEFTIEFEIG